MFRTKQQAKPGGATKRKKDYVQRVDLRTQTVLREMAQRNCRTVPEQIRFLVQEALAKEGVENAS